MPNLVKKSLDAIKARVNRDVSILPNVIQDIQNTPRRIVSSLNDNTGMIRRDPTTGRQSFHVTNPTYVKAYNDFKEVGNTATTKLRSIYDDIQTKDPTDSTGTRIGKMLLKNPTHSINESRKGIKDYMQTGKVDDYGRFFFNGLYADSQIIGDAYAAKNIIKAIPSVLIGAGSKVLSNAYENKPLLNDIGEGVMSGVETSYLQSLSSGITDKLAFKLAPKLTSEAIDGAWKQAGATIGRGNKIPLIKNATKLLFQRALAETPTEGALYGITDYLKQNKPDNETPEQAKDRFKKTMETNFISSGIGNALYAGGAGIVRGGNALGRQQIELVQKALGDAFRKTVQQFVPTYKRATKIDVNQLQQEQAFKEMQTGLDQMQANGKLNTMLKENNGRLGTEYMGQDQVQQLQNEGFWNNIQQQQLKQSEESKKALEILSNTEQIIKAKTGVIDPYARFGESTQTEPAWREILRSQAGEADLGADVSTKNLGDIQTGAQVKEGLKPLADLDRAIQAGDREGAQQALDTISSTKEGLLSEYNSEGNIKVYQKAIDSLGDTKIGEPITQGKILTDKIEQTKIKLQTVQDDLMQIQDQRAFAKGENARFTSTQRKAITSMQNTIARLENKGLDPTNVSTTIAYKKNIEDIMAELKTTSEDEAVAFIKNYSKPANPPIKEALAQQKLLDKQLKELQGGVYVTENGTVHFDPQFSKDPIKEQRLLAEQDYNEWQKSLYKQTVKEESAETKQTVNRMMDLIKNNTKSVGAQNVENLHDIRVTAVGWSDMDRNFKTVYGDQYPEAKAEFLDKFYESKGNMYKALDTHIEDLKTNVIDKYGIKPRSEMSADVQMYGEGNISYEELAKKYGAEKADNIVNADSWFRKNYDKLLDEVNKTMAQIYPNQPEKIIPKRKDYYRHFTQMSEGIEGLYSILESPTAISSSLAGVSLNTKPKSKWLSFAQRRLGVRTEVDAVSGFLDYAKSAEYAKNIDPHIAKLRALANEIRVSTEGLPPDKRLNNFVTFLDRQANQLAGKSSSFDAPVQEAMIGRKSMGVVNWLNNRIKSNTIIGNAGVGVAQFFNIPQGVAEAGPEIATKAMGKTLKELGNENADYQQSQFLKERFYNSFDQFDTGMMDKPKKLALWIITAGDEISTKYIWNMQYMKALQNATPDPVNFADFETRRLVAGRGIGEMPLVQKSKLFQLVAPFQYEMTNSWHLMGDWVSKKEFKKLMTFFIASYVMNKGAEKLRGSGVVFDPVQASADAYKAYSEEENKLKGLTLAGGRLAGEVLSNVPFGQTAAMAYPEYGKEVLGVQLPTREQLFGEGDPTRFGGGLVLTKGLQDPLYKVLPPFGGSQLKKTIEGLSAVNKGYSETSTGRVRYPIEKNFTNYVKGGLFGENSTSEARKYFKDKVTALGEKQSENFKNATNKVGAYAKVMKDRAFDRDRDAQKESKSTNLITNGDNLYTTYNETKGEEVSFDLNKVLSMKNEKNFAQSIRSAKAMTMASDIYDSQIPEKDKNGLYDKLGVNVDDVEYYNVAKENNDAKTLYVTDFIDSLNAQTTDRGVILEQLIELRKNVNGNLIAADGVLSDLVDSGYLTKQEVKVIKAQANAKKTGRATGGSTGGGKAKKGKKTTPPTTKTRSIFKSKKFTTPKLAKFRALKGKARKTPKIAFNVPKQTVAKTTGSTPTLNLSGTTFKKV